MFKPTRDREQEILFAWRDELRARSAHLHDRREGLALHDDPKKTAKKIMKWIDAEQNAIRIAKRQFEHAYRSFALSIGIEQANTSHPIVRFGKRQTSS